MNASPFRTPLCNYPCCWRPNSILFVMEQMTFFLKQAESQCLLYIARRRTELSGKERHPGRHTCSPKSRSSLQTPPPQGPAAKQAPSSFLHLPVGLMRAALCMLGCRLRREARRARHGQGQHPPQAAAPGTQACEIKSSVCHTGAGGVRHTPERRLLSSCMEHRGGDAL